MDAQIFKEIAFEIKGLHNGAAEHIKRKEFAEAAVQYRKALIITEKIKYYEGMAMTLFNMANLSMIVGDLCEAVNNAADARDMFEKAGQPSDNCHRLLDQLALIVKKEGIKLEKQGKFQEAIEYYEACIPFADEASQKAMQHEVKLLRKITHAGK